MNGLKEWWDQNTPRDQMALFFLGIAVVVFLMYFLVSATYSSYTEQLQRNQRVTASLNQVRELSAELLARKGSNEAKPRSSLNEMVNNSLRKHGLRLSSMQPQSNGAVRLRMEKMPYQNIIAWLHEMEVVQGISIKDSTLTTSSDGVSITVTLIN